MAKNDLSTHYLSALGNNAFTQILLNSQLASNCVCVSVQWYQLHHAVKNSTLSLVSLLHSSLFLLVFSIVCLFYCTTVWQGKKERQIRQGPFSPDLLLRPSATRLIDRQMKIGRESPMLSTGGGGGVLARNFIAGKHAVWQTHFQVMET